MFLEYLKTCRFFCKVTVQKSVATKLHRGLYIANSMFKSFVTRSYASDSAIARRGEGDNVTDDLELE